MNINTRGNKLEVTEAIGSYIDKKIAKLEKYFENPEEITANVLIKTYGNRQVVEVTIPIHKIILRAEEASDDLYKSVDLVSEKLERQIRKNKTRIKNKKHTALMPTFTDFEVTEEEQTEEQITKRKTVDAKPMTEEEAILQMNLIGHDFFLFTNVETQTACVIYKRKDGNYGLIEIK
jgi:putative sigma-54 modulation protein